MGSSVCVTEEEEEEEVMNESRMIFLFFLWDKLGILGNFKAEEILAWKAVLLTWHHHSHLLLTPHAVLTISDILHVSLRG